MQGVTSDVGLVHFRGSPRGNGYQVWDTREELGRRFPPVHGIERENGRAGARSVTQGGHVTRIQIKGFPETEVPRQEVGNSEGGYQPIN